MNATPPRLIDRPAQLRARARALAGGGGPDFLAERVAEDLGDRLVATLRRFPRALDLLTPGTAFAERLAARPGGLTTVRAAPTEGDGGGLVCGFDALPFGPGAFDLIVSGLALHLADDLPGLFAQVRGNLAPDGLFLAAVPGGDTLTELRQSLAFAEAETAGGASPRIAPFAELRAFGGLLQRAGFALPVVDLDRVTIRYDSALGLMQDLRAWGATNALEQRSRKPLTRQALIKALETYAERFSDPDGRVRATFDIVWVSGWAPHESQQKPLKPGSAKARLADALGVTEGEPKKI